MLLGGWLLMVPPLDKTDSYKVREDAPITEWSQEEAFDSARACEVARSGLERYGRDGRQSHRSS